MASPVPPRTTSTAPSQPAGTPTANFPHLAPKSSTLSIDATNAFRPSIPQKDSRIPAVEIDKLSLSKMNNQNNGKTTSIDTSVLSPGGVQSSLPPPPLPHPPIKGISNAQARTARKSAPSSSNRGDGYSTSSSGGGGKKSISSTGKNNKDKGERETFVIDEISVTPISRTESSSLTRSPQPQTPPLSAPPKQQPQTQPQPQKPQQEAQLSLESGGGPQQQKEAMSPVIPSPPSFAGPPAQVAGVKRPAPQAIPPVLSVFSSMMSGKPKRQKIATAKAAALASEAMNADGSAAKKRKQRKNLSEKGGKEKEKLGKGKGKELKGLGMFVAVLRNDCDPGETVQPCRPILPPAYQKPPYQRPATQQEQGKKDTLNSYPVATGFRPACPDLQTLNTSCEVPTTPQASSVVPAAHIQTPVAQRQVPDDVISISSSPSGSIQYNTPTAKLEGKDRQEQDDRGNRPIPETDQMGRHQSTPITIDDGCSEGEEILNDAKSLAKEYWIEVFGPLRDTSKDKREFTPWGHSNCSRDVIRMREVFFEKCMDNSDDEGTEISCLIEGFIERLLEGVKRRLLSFRGQNYLRCRYGGDSRSTELALKIKNLNVLTDEGEIITFDGWKNSGRPKFEGIVVLSGYPEAWEKALNTESLDGDTSLSRGRLLGVAGDKTKHEIDTANVVDQHTASSPEAPAKPRGTTPVDRNSEPCEEEQAEIKDHPTTDNLKENLDLADDPSQPVGNITSSPMPQKLPPPERPASPAKSPIPQSRLGQKPSSPSNQIQAEADASVTNFKRASKPFSPFQVSIPTPFYKGSGKGKRKAFVAPTVEDFLNESRVVQELQSPLGPGLNPRQEKNDPLLARIVDLNQQELRVQDDIDALAAKSKLKEIEFERRIAGARVGAKASIDDGDFELGPGVSSQVDWEGFRKATKELMDFQDETRREELRLADKAARIAEEKQYLIERRKRSRRMESESETTPSLTASEDRSLDNGGSTAPSSAPSSVSGSSAAREEIPPSIDVGAKAIHPEMSIGHELLQALIPWAKQLQETTTENTPPAFTEAGANQTKSKKKPIRKKKHW